MLVAVRADAAASDTSEAVRARVPARTRHYAASVARQFRILTITTRIGAGVSAFFGIISLLTWSEGIWIGVLNVVSAVIYLLTPLLYRFGELLAPLTFFLVAYGSIALVSWHVGTGSGVQFYYLVAASIIVLVLGIEHIVLASSLAALGVAIVIALEFLVPADTGLQPAWGQTIGFVVSAISCWVLVVATVWYSLRETARAEKAMDDEYERSEALLTNILPASVAQRLKDPSHEVIADRYDDASVLFADIAGYTKRASAMTPTELVQFLDRLYTILDALVDHHRLEKIKTSGDSYMVVSGVPQPRPDHLEALAGLALDMNDAVAELTDPRGRAVPLRVGIAAGPVVAGIVGASKFFYDVWGDAVNVASRMETTDVAGRIQVPHNVYELLRHAFVFEERGDVDVKGKGLMHTWYLVGRLPDLARSESLRQGG